MNTITRFEFVFLIGDGDDDWISAENLINQSNFLIDLYTAIDALNHCDFVGGILIDIDGTAWSDVGSIDEFGFTMSGLRALQQLLDGQPTARAMPREESQLTLTRSGELMEMQDIHPSGIESMRQVRVPFVRFIEHVLQAMNYFRLVAAEMRDEIARRRERGVADSVEAKLAIIEANLPGTIDRSLTDLATALAIFQSQET